MNEVLKTGTTTVGIVYKDGIVLAADKRATAGHLIAHKAVKKIHEIAKSMALTTAGSVSDIQLMLKLIKAELKLKQIRSYRESTVKEAANLLASLVYSNLRQYFPGITHFLFAGFDTQSHLYDIYPDGSCEEIHDIVASGSGSVFAYGVLETSYKKGMTEKEAVDLAVKSVVAALQRDSASGNGLDVVVVNKDGVKTVISKIIETKID
ncbi:proteasome subunit beta [Nanoarchaeota archaeon]